MAVGTVVVSFAVLALGLLSTFAFVFIEKSKRIKGRYFLHLSRVLYLNSCFQCSASFDKVSAIRSRTLERKSSTMYKRRDVKTETSIDKLKQYQGYGTRNA